MHATLNRVLPKQIMCDRRLRRTSQLIYSCMRAHPKSTFKGYAAKLSIPYATVRRCIKELEHHDWVYSFRDPKSGERIYVPWMPLDVEKAVASRAEQLADVMPNRGEWLMKAVLDITVDDDNFLNNARFQWTVSGTGDNRLEFDRFYPDARVAIEFQGRQHYEEVTFRDGKTNLQKQQDLDGRKALACLRQQVTLVEIPDIELSYETLVAKLGGLLPFLPPRTDRPLFRTLANLCHGYVNWAMDRRGQG